MVTPWQLSHRSELYQQLAQLTHAGFGLPQAVESQIRAPSSPSFRPPLKRILNALQQGSTFSEAILQTGPWMPSFDRALLEAGERSGRLPACFNLLSVHYRERAQLAREMLSELAYPVFLFHFAILIGPAPTLVLSGSFAGYFSTIAAALIPIYAVLICLFYASKSTHGEGWRTLMERLSQMIPLLGRARRHLAVSRLAASLEALLSAGVPIIEAWELSSAASGSPIMHRTVRRWRGRIDQGITPSQLVQESGYFPAPFGSLYHTGEISGGLDTTLQRLHAYHLEEGTRILRNLCRWIPRIVYLAIVFMIAYRVVSFWLGYFNQIGNAISG